VTHDGIILSARYSISATRALFYAHALPVLAHLLSSRSCCSHAIEVSQDKTCEIGTNFLPYCSATIFCLIGLSECRDTITCMLHPVDVVHGKLSCEGMPGWNLATAGVLERAMSGLSNTSISVLIDWIPVAFERLFHTQFLPLAPPPSGDRNYSLHASHAERKAH
jgi:hypothetical protein